MMLVKLVNLSLQGFNVFLTTDSGSRSFWLTPKESVLIPESSVSGQIKRMIKKRLLKLERV